MQSDFFSNLFIGAFGELLNQPTTWMLILAVTLLFVAKVFSRHIKGKIGEWALSKILNKKCGNNCIVLDDVTLEVSDGDTTQVDHVVISPTGIFVVETKHYKGWIYGKESDQFWTQKIFKRSYKFQNPFRQNYKHVKAIQSLLPSIPQEAFYSIVVMVGECEWRSKNTPKLLFTSGWKAADYIYEQSKESSFIDINSVYESLESARLEKGLKTNFKHVKNLKAKHRA